MHLHMTVHRILVMVMVSLWLGACGAPTASEPTPTPAPPTVTPLLEAPAPTLAPPVPTGEVNTLTDVRLATIRITSRGNFVPPGRAEGVNRAGSGSGFIVDPSGIAVTNNHVVTGAALIEVYVSGEDRPRNARVLGVAECSDLAVIQIEGRDFRYLNWYPNPIDAGLEVFTAGFPEGDPEYTITKGVVSKQRADGKTSWASVERVIEHDATIRPGNSGGPLVTSSGQVVAVNYGGYEGGPYYAIARDEALALIDRLRAGENITSIGLNGRAIRTDDLHGIWVSSVRSGSPLDRAGVKPGDFITHVEGLEMARDGTMADFCQILRSRNPEDVLGLRVYRPTTDNLLEGQVNGRELQPVSAPAPATPTAAAVTRNVAALDLTPGEADQLRQAYRQQFERGREIRFETFDNADTKHFWSQTETAAYRTSFGRPVAAVYNFTFKMTGQPAIEPLRVYREEQAQVVRGNYLLEAAISFNGQAATSVGVTVDGQPNGDRIYFFLNSQGSFDIITVRDRQVQEAYSLLDVATPSIIPGTNTLQVLRSEQNYLFFINHTPVAMLVEPPFNGGTVGLTAMALNGASLPTTVLADNFRLRTIGP